MPLRHYALSRPHSVQSAIAFGPKSRDFVNLSLEHLAISNRERDKDVERRQTHYASSHPR